MIDVVKLALSHEKKRKDIKNNAKRINNKMQRLFIEQHPDAVMAFDLHGNFLSVNKSFTDMLECSREESLGLNFSHFLPDDEKDRVTGYFNRSLTGETIRYETKAITAKGKLIFLHVLKFPIVADNQVIGVYGRARDITKQKLEEDQLRQSEEKFRSIIENAQIGFLLTAPEGSPQVINANKAALDMFGYTLEEIRKLKREDLLDFMTPDTLVHFESRLKKGSATGEIIAIRKNGERFPCEFSSVIFKDINGELRTSSNMIDISKRKASEEDAHNRQELLNAIIDNSNDGIAVTDLNGHFIIFNRAMVELLGVGQTDSGEFDWSNLFQIYYPYTRQSVPKNELPIVRAMSGKFVKDQIFLIQNPQKGDVYMSVSSSAIRDSTDNIVASLVIDRDITKQVNYENDLLQAIKNLEISNLRFSLATKATYDAVWDWDLVNNKLDMGEGFKTIFGPDLNLSSSVDFLFDHIHPDDLGRVRTSIKTALADPQQDKWAADFLFQRADGTFASVADKCLILRNDQGAAIRAVGAVQDVTERQENLLSIQNQNIKLLQIAWTQSHLLRGPISRIMGLSDLLKDPATDKKTSTELLNYLDASIKELDGIVVDIVKNAEIITNTIE
jgi:PAS domain S-box-containing protein